MALRGRQQFAVCIGLERQWISKLGTRSAKTIPNRSFSRLGLDDRTQQVAGCEVIVEPSTDHWLGPLAAAVHGSVAQAVHLPRSSANSAHWHRYQCGRGRRSRCVLSHGPSRLGPRRAWERVSFAARCVRSGDAVIGGQFPSGAAFSDRKAAQFVVDRGTILGFHSKRRVQPAGTTAGVVAPGVPWGVVRPSCRPGKPAERC
mmetsp:Transcript_27237/g.70575  ORF Transcript_27237/g.70575 Transcript_27237/m.70575 type:complete len:202 (+) Transcript_27237:1018-1623(+)